MRQTLRPLKVLLVHELFPPDFAGGGEYIVFQIARHLQALGHTVTVVSTGDPAITEFQGIRTRRLSASRYRMNFAWKIVAEAARDVDLIHAFTYHAIYPAFRAGKALRKPVVRGVLALFGDVWLEMRGPFTGRLYRSMEKFLLSLPMDANFYLSEFSHDFARSMNLHQSTDAVIEPGISLEEYFAHHDKTYVMFTGKLDVRKGIDIVLRVAEQLPDVPFRVIGWGERYDEIAAAKPPNVQLERPENRNHLLDAFARARIFLFPTKAETFGLVVAEAMASGCAIVSTSPLPFEGARVQENDVPGTVRAVRELWNNPERCTHCGESNRRLAQRYNWRRHADELEQAYWRALDNRALLP